MARICPTCEAEVSEKKEVSYFANVTMFALDEDDVRGHCEEAERIAKFLGALAIATPLAMAHDSNDRYVPEWGVTLSWLAEEMSRELNRRLLRLEKAVTHWQRQAEALQKTASGR